MTKSRIKRCFFFNLNIFCLNNNMNICAKIVIRLFFTYAGLGLLPNFASLTKDDSV